MYINQNFLQQANITVQKIKKSLMENLIYLYSAYEFRKSGMTRSDLMHVYITINNNKIVTLKAYPSYCKILVLQTQNLDSLDLCMDSFDAA